MGEGMPWHIIMTFFTIGILYGRYSYKKDVKDARKARLKKYYEENPEAQYEEGAPQY